MKTHEEHVRRVQALHGDSVRVVGQYRHSKTKVEYECPTHGTFMAYPSNVENGARCRKCSCSGPRKTHDGHVRQVAKVHPHLTVVGTYSGIRKKILYGCPKHGEFLAIPNNVESGTGCMKCRNEGISRRSRKDPSLYVEQAAALGYKVLGTYTTALTPIPHQCHKGHTWETSPNQALSGYGCPLCDKSQYRRRPIVVGTRSVFVQGSEGAAVKSLLEEGVLPEDLAFTTKEGRPTFRYDFGGRTRSYTPDMFQVSRNLVIEVKSAATLGMFDADLFAQVQAKARSVLEAGYELRLILIHRGRGLPLPEAWPNKVWSEVVADFRKACQEGDRRRGSKSPVSV